MTEVEYAKTLIYNDYEYVSEKFRITLSAIIYYDRQVKVLKTGEG